METFGIRFFTGEIELVFLPKWHIWHILLDFQLFFNVVFFICQLSESYLRFTMFVFICLLLNLILILWSF